MYAHTYNADKNGKERRTLEKGIRFDRAYHPRQALSTRCPCSVAFSSHDIQYQRDDK